MLKTALKIAVLAAGVAILAGFNPADLPRAEAADPAKGRIIVRSNVMTSWVISGPENFSGSGNFGSYYATPGTSDYFVSAPSITDAQGNVMNGPFYVPGMNQTLRAGETIYFDINYNYGELTGPEDCKNSWGYLEGKFLTDGKYTGVATATMTNKSTTCTYTVGIASYKMYEVELTQNNDNWLNTQTLYQTKTFTLAPGQSLGPDVVNIALPPCRTQLDLFEGVALSPPVYNTEGHFLMDYRFVDKDLCNLVETGTLTVSSNIPTSWTITGPQNYSGSGTYGGYTTPVGSYTLTSVPTTLVYNNATYELTSALPQTQTVAPSTLTQFIITYQERFELNKPSITAATNATCSKITVTWNDNSNNESGFRVYRSTQSHNGDINLYQLVTTLPANTTTFVDSPALNNSYYYIVSAYSASPSAVSSSNHTYSAFNRPCSAQIEGSLNIVAINGSTEFSTSNINAGDTITFELMVDNLGPSDGYITKISESLSANLINPRNMNASGENMVIGNPRIIGSNPEFTLNVSGKKEVGGNKWVIRYDVTTTFTVNNSTSAFSNCATIHYYDQTGNKTENVCMNQLMTGNQTKAGVDFREVAP